MKTSQETQNKQLVTGKHFTDLREQIAEFKKLNEQTVFDYESKKGEKDARSYIYKLRQSKSAIAKRHKEDKAEALKVGKELDAAKRELTEEIDGMISVHQDSIDAIKEKREKEEQFENDFDAALIENEFIDRERAIARKEAEQLRIEEEKRIEEGRKEEERKAKEEAERKEKERIEYEERLKKEAAEKAKKEAEGKARKEKEEAERKIREAKEREERLKREAEEAEKKRIADIEAAKKRAEQEKIEAARKAEREKQEALDRQRREQEEKERAEKERAEEKKRAEERKAANLNHRKAVNNRVLKKLIQCDISEENAKDIIKDIVLNEIPEITINY